MTTHLGLGLLIFAAPLMAAAGVHAQGTAQALRVGIIGLDTSHSPAFTEILNAPDAAPDVSGFRVVAAYPHGSPDIESSVSRIPRYTEAVQAMGVEIVESIEALLGRVDVVLLETNDGRPHLAQALQVIEAGKPLFVDKPMAASLADVVKIFDAARRRGVPVFSSSSLRFMAPAQAIREGSIGAVHGADAYSPATLEPTHPDLFWYGIHGVETLFTVMGTGCETVQRFHTEGADVVVGTWAGGRIGTFRGIRGGTGGYGGTAFGEDGIAPIGPYEGYRPLVAEIARFFRTGVPPVTPEETLEIYAFMEAADQSKRDGGAPVRITDVLEAATRKARR
jgi:predicted dehydrogenase